MSDNRCPDCGSPLSEDGSVCPRCAMSLALGGGEPETVAPDGATEGAPPPSIGPYRLIRRLGVGGMGEVWLAEQTAPVTRQVALKIVKSGLGGASLIARFESERQALARMEHPAIARVLDAGTTETGSPYFAMEYVRGEPITDYADKHRLTARQRLRLFRQVCDGVQHAHQKAMVHRDLKPSNILVLEQDGVPVPKIIDFGVAKALDPGGLQASRFTERGVLLGTPEYMSPEQARADGGEVDTRSDVYSLGVVLYELLSGSLPLDSKELRRAGYEELLRRIRETEPPKPSSRVTESTASKLLRGDLDWITMKALEKEPARRYDSPAELGRDIDRFLLDEPVSAGPPSAGYRVRKFVRRHRVGVAAAALIAVVTLAGFAGTAYGLVRATRSEAAAKRDAAVAENISEFLTGLFEVSNPSEARGNSVTAREILDRGVERIGSSLEDDPATQGRLMTVMGEVYLRLGLLQDAKGLLERSVSIQEQALGSNHDETLVTKGMLGAAHAELNELEDAKQIGEEVLEGRIALHGEDHPATAEALSSMGATHYYLGEYPQAEEYLRRSLEIRRELGQENSEEAFITLTDLGAVLRGQGKADEGMDASKRALDGRLEVLGPDHPDTIDSYSSYGNALYSLGRMAEAEEAFRTAADLGTRVLGPGHPWTLLYASNRCSTLYELGRYAEAEEQSRELADVRERTLGADHPDTLASRQILGMALQRLNRLDEAQPILEQTVDAYERALGPNHPQTLHAVNNLGAVYHQQLKLEQAGRMYERALYGQREVGGPNKVSTLMAAGNLADVWREAGRLDEAMELIEETLGRVREHIAPEHALVGYTLGKYGDCLVDAKRYEEAEPVLLEGYEQLVEASNVNNPAVGSIVLDLIQLYTETGRTALADEWRARHDASRFE